MEKNQDQFARRFEGIPAPVFKGEAEEMSRSSVTVYTKEELSMLLLPDLKQMCKGRELIVGDNNKEGVIALLLAHQSESE